MTSANSSNRRVLLTGALGTLGRAQAKRLAQQGDTLVLLDLPELAAQGAEFAQELGNNAFYLGLDLNNLTEVERRVSELVSKHPIDVLINNAALIINRPFEEFDISEYEDQIRVNSSAIFTLVKAVCPAMKQKRYGKIINFCSLVLNGRWDGYVPYVASKGAVLGLTKSLARELGSFGIRVNAIAPGAVVSQAEARVFGDRLQQYNDWILENQALKSRIQPEDVANLVQFLASPASDMITGQNIGIDGGW